ncbi:LlaJI family restriction endonuclease [Facklamia sp. P12955]|uniref:LlaJI family restriction endonuclease n=1 Tax=Facklamia sp. P12955 TaxID=3421946 RepID=UPI003D179AC4
MKVEILQELKPYSFNQIKRIFNKSDVSTEDILKSLGMTNIVRKINKDIQETELEELLNIENIEVFENESDIFVFKFVGMIVVEEVCLIIYPKYLSDYKIDRDRNYSDLRQILKVIKKYKFKEQKIDGSGSIFSKYNLLSTALELIEDYHENGLYRNDQQIIEVNGDGEILWEKTINESQAYFSQNRPFYLDIFNVSQINDKDDYFRRLHAAILTDLSKKLKEIFDIINVESLLLTDEKIENFGSYEYINTNIDREMRTQFVTSRVEVLKLIKRYLLESESFSSNQKISFLGTSSFNLVWEDVCSVVFGNNLKTPLKELGLKYSENVKNSALLVDVIPKPIWKSNEFNVEHSAKRTLIPDIVVVENEGIYIYDAKYYKIVLDDKKVEKQPGVEDITKQYLYELAFKNLANENNLEFKENSFILPTDKEDPVHIGEVSLDFLRNLNGLNQSKIDVYLMPAREFFKRYVER